MISGKDKAVLLSGCGYGRFGAFIPDRAVAGIFIRIGFA